MLAKVINTKHVGTSTMGNPCYEVELEWENGSTSTHKTTSNAGIAYAIENTEYATEWHEYVFTRAGNIRSANRV